MAVSSDPIKVDRDILTVRDQLKPMHLRRFCAVLYQQIEKKGYKDITLDFSRCDSVNEAFMLPAIPTIVGYREKKNVDFELILPQEEGLQRLFKNTNWAHHINPQAYEIADYEGGHLPALQYQDATTQAKLVDRVVELVLRQIENLERHQLTALEWSLNEITDNVLQHAQSDIGGFVQATAYGESKRVEFVVADGGIGIPESMNMSRKPEQAVQRAIEEGETRNKESNQGNGLFGSYRVALLSDGLFEINSALAHLLVVGREGKVSVRALKTPYQGTSVRCSIGFENPDLLVEALRFGDETHIPSYDYIERKYEAGDDMQFALANYRDDVRSREGGKRVRTALENLLNDPNAPRVVVDFSAISVISSSFADEVFGRLFIKLGPRNFSKRIDIQNADRTTDVLIDRAILQRAQTAGNGNGK